MWRGDTPPRVSVLPSLSRTTLTLALRSQRGTKGSHLLPGCLPGHVQYGGFQRFSSQPGGEGAAGNPLIRNSLRAPPFLSEQIRQ